MPYTRVPYTDTRKKRQILRYRRYVRRKARGHSHQVYEIKNTKGLIVSRCKICKFHFFKFI